MIQSGVNFTLSALPGLMVFLCPALEASLLLGAIYATSLKNFVLGRHFWPFNEAIALDSSS